MRIQGQKGKKPSSAKARTPREAANTLQSKNTARIIDVVGEGPIVGLINGLQSVFLDGTPIENDDGTLNFEGVVVDERLGEPDQDILPGFPFVEEEVDIGVKVEFGSPIVRTLTDSDVDALRVKVRIPQLTSSSTTTGDINGTSISFNIEYQPNGESYRKIPGNFEWAAFSGTQTTATDVEGLKVTLSNTISGLANTKQDVDFEVQYRAVGDVTWLTLGERTVTTTLPSAGDARSLLVQKEETNFLEDRETPTTTSITVSASFELIGLTSDQYEIQAVSGTIISSENQIPTPIVISGKTTSPYEESYRFDLTGESPWNIRVTRITADSESSFLQNDLYFSTYTKVIDAKFIYPDSAYYGIKVDAELFGQEIPARAYEVKGLKIQVPTNYNPVTRQYNNVWDGTFQSAWSDNPAWILYDILTNSRYGLGEYIEDDQVDKWSLYDIGVYCDELVDDGYGGTEPRFTFNACLNSRREAYDVINAISSAFRGMVFWDQGSVFAAQDSPADMEVIVAPANVINGEFNYSGSALKARHTACLVTWNDPENGFEPAIAVVEDATAINDFGWRQLDTVAFGCTSRGQATRWGRWILDSEKYETETVTYRCAFDHADVRPGQIIGIADPTYAGVRMGGRIRSAAATTLVVDDNVEFEAGETYTVTVVLPDGSLVDRTLLNPEATTSTLSFPDPLTTLPAVGAMWVVTASNVEPRTFRVLVNRELEKGTYEITAMLHDPTKYDRVEENLVVEAPDYTTIPTGALLAPSDLNVTEYLYQAGPSVKSAATFSWTPARDQRVGYYEVLVLEPESSGYRFIDTVKGTAIDLQDTKTGEYSFKIRSLDKAGGFKSPYVTLDVELVSLLGKPGDVDNFSMNVIDGTAYFSWDPVTDLDLDYYQIRYTPTIGNPSWGAMNMLLEKIPKSAASVHLPLAIGTYAIKAVDTSEEASETANFITTTIYEVLQRNLVETVNEHPDFDGSLTDVVAIDDALRLDADGTMDDWPDVDAVDNWDFGIEGLVLEGTYTNTNTTDLGAIYTSRITGGVSAYGTDIYTNVDDWADIDNIENWDGADPSEWEVEIQIQQTNDDPAVSPTWSAWRRLVIGDYTGRGFQARYILRSFQEGVTPVVEEAYITIDMPDRVIGSNDVTDTEAGPTRITFNPAFKVLNSVGITTKDGASGDYYLISDDDETGFTIEFFDSEGITKGATFSWIAKGYGGVSTALPFPTTGSDNELDFSLSANSMYLPLIV